VPAHHRTIRPHLRRLIELFILNNPLSWQASKDRWDAIVVRHGGETAVSGFSAENIAERFGCTSHWVRTIRRELVAKGLIDPPDLSSRRGPQGRGTGPRHNGHAAKAAERVRLFLVAKPAGVDALPLATLSKVLGCSRATIRRARRMLEAA
jgi:hypothetical protein